MAGASKTDLAGRRIALRRRIQASDESVRALARRYGVNPKTVQKWRRRVGPASLRPGPGLSERDEATIVLFRRDTLLPLDDCLYALQLLMPWLTRASLHRVLARNGVGRLPKPLNEMGPRGSSRSAIGTFRLTATPTHTEEGTGYIFTAIDRCCKFLVSDARETANAADATAFLDRIVARAPYRVRTVITDDQATFGSIRPGTGPAPLGEGAFSVHCRHRGIVHLVTRPNYPWTPRQIEQMAPMLSRACGNHVLPIPFAELEIANRAFEQAYNDSKRFKRLAGLTPREFAARAAMNPTGKPR